jgi:transcriptional regulator with XRE-family HTH domain
MFRAIRYDSPPYVVNGKPPGQLLVQERAVLGLTHKALAERLGVSRKTLQNWECSRTEPNRNSWPAIKSLFAAAYFRSR